MRNEKFFHFLLVKKEVVFIIGDKINLSINLSSIFDFCKKKCMFFYNFSGFGLTVVKIIFKDLDKHKKDRYEK